MAPPVVKICGVRTPAMAAATAAAGAELAGLNLVPGRRRAIAPEDAPALIAALGPVEAVGVFLDAPLERVRRLAEALALPWVQLHGDEPPEDCARLRADGRRVIKAIAVRPDEAPATRAARLAAFRETVDAFLFDAPRAGGGQPFDWGRLDVRGLDRPFLVAGGLSAANVAEALRALSPWGVDTASGAERDGHPDPAAIHAFVAAARGQT